MYGMPGEIDLPSAKNLPDGQFSISSSTFAGTIRVNLSFQILENLTGAFRYARIPGGNYNGYTWDRSFDIHYLASREKSFSGYCNRLKRLHWYRYIHRRIYCCFKILWFKAKNFCGYRLGKVSGGK